MNWWVRLGMAMAPLASLSTHSNEKQSFVSICLQSQLPNDEYYSNNQLISQKRSWIRIRMQMSHNFAIKHHGRSQESIPASCLSSIAPQWKASTRMSIWGWSNNATQSTPAKRFQDSTVQNISGISSMIRPKKTTMPPAMSPATNKLAWSSSIKHKHYSTSQHNTSQHSTAQHKNM